MSSHVILLTDAHEAPAYELIEALRAAGVKTLIEGLREVEVEKALAQRRKREGLGDSEGPPPLAVLYEVVPGADMVELHTAIDHAKAFWPGAPLVACRRQTNGYQSHNLRSLDGPTLKRLGFLAVADKSAQLPAMLREIEAHDGSSELRLPEAFQPPPDAEPSSLPKKIKISHLREPYDQTDFNRLIKRWLPLCFAVNSLNRSMGHADFYPFILSAAVIEKLRFIHELCYAGVKA